MRRLLLAVTLIAVIFLAGGLASAYVLRDRFLLREARLQAEKLAPLQVEIGSLHTVLLGSFSAEVGGLEVLASPSGPSVKIREARLESPLGLPGLFRACRSGAELPLSLTVTGLKAHFPPGAPGSASAKPAGWPRSLPLPAASPVPVRLTLALKGGEASGAFTAKDVQLQGEARLRPTGLEATLGTGGSFGSGDALLPVSADVKVVAGPGAVKLQSLTFRAAGLEGAGNGELALSPVKGTFQLGVDAPDLARVALRPADRAALGLTAQPTGAVALRSSGTVSERGAVSVAGTLRLENLLLALRAPEKTAYSGLAPGQHVDGVVSLHAGVPFRVSAPGPAGPFTTSVDKASLGFDLTQASLVSQGKLEKARGIPLRGELTVSSSERGVEIPSLTLAFHTLSLTGAASVPTPLGSEIASGFRLQVSSLAGFPALLPMLRAAETPGLADAQGSIQAEGSVRLFPSAPGKSLVDLKTLSIRGLRLPLAYAGDAVGLRGVLTGAASGGGSFDAGDVRVSRTSGSFDLTGLDITVPGKFAKKRGRKLVVAFDAQGTPARLAVKKASVQADGLGASLAGTAVFDARRNATLNLSTTAHADLAALREYLPKLPAKISGGVFDASARILGTWMPAGGIEKSPLLLSGRVTGKLGTVVMEAPAAAAPGAQAKPRAPEPLLPPWPAARNASFGFRFDVAQFRRGALEASGISAAGTLNKGVFNLNASVARAFGGRASLKSLTGTLTSPKLAVRGAASVDGLDLSQAAAFVDPSYGRIVKGSLKADSTIEVPDAWSGKLLEEAQANGQAQVHGAYLSTATFAGLVNEKLRSIPGVGDKAKVNAGGVAAEIRTAFSVAGGTANLRDFVALIQPRDEMRLGGSLNLAFDCDLSGEAHVSDAPVSGAIREANSDSLGRLVVPVHFHGNLKNPSVDVATGAVEAMLKKTAAHEGEKLRSKALDAAKQKAQQGIQDAAGGLLDQLKKGISR